MKTAAEIKRQLKYWHQDLFFGKKHAKKFKKRLYYCDFSLNYVRVFSKGLTRKIIKRLKIK